MSDQKPGESDRELARVVDRNIKVLIERRQQEEREQSFQNRVVSLVTRFMGSVTFAWLHVALFGGWIAFNQPWFASRPFDPGFSLLTMIATVEAIFLSTFVLITQNRMAAQADKRADLDLQISLLAEHEITRLVSLVSALAEKFDLEESRNPEIAELARDVAPEKVLDRIEEHSRRK